MRLFTSKVKAMIAPNATALAEYQADYELLWRFVHLVAESEHEDLRHVAERLLHEHPQCPGVNLTELLIG